MKKSQITEIINLYQEGNSIEDIQEITGHDLEQIEPLIDDFKEQATLPLSGIEKANALKERELNHLEKQEFIKSEKQKRKILKEFTTLAEGLLDHCQGSTWDRDSIKKSYTEINNLIEEVEEIFAFDRDEMENNSVYEILQVLKTQFEGLSQQDPDYKVTIDWSQEKIEMLQYAMSIKDFDESNWDREDYNLQRAHNVYVRFMEKLADMEESKVDSEQLEQLQSDLTYVRDTIDSDLPGIEGEFEEELEVIDQLEIYFNELSIRIDESFWGQKRMELPKSLKEVLNQLDDVE